MHQFITKHSDKITGTISCFDRIFFKGHLPLGWPQAMEGFLAGQGLRIKNFGPFVNRHSERIKQHARALAQHRGRPYLHLTGPIRKEDRVQAIVRRDQITERLVCVLAAVEACHSFKLAYGEGKPRPYRGFNPAARDDVRLFAAVMRGEHLLQGFANRDIRSQLFPPISDSAASRREFCQSRCHSAHVSRLLKRLHVHGLIAKVRGSRRWRVTRKGHALMTTILVLHHERYPVTLRQHAA